MKVVKTVDVAIQNLENMEDLLTILKNLGERHVPRGVTKGDYETLGGAIMLSLEQALGSAFNFELKRAWGIVYTALKNGCIADNYDLKEHLEHLTRNCQLNFDEMEVVMKNW